MLIIKTIREAGVLPKLNGCLKDSYSIVRQWAGQIIADFATQLKQVEANDSKPAHYQTIVLLNGMVIPSNNFLDELKLWQEAGKPLNQKDLITTMLNAVVGSNFPICVHQWK